MSSYKNHQLCRQVSVCFRLIAVTLLLAVSASAFADTHLELSITGPESAPSGYPVEGIAVRLVNQDQNDAPASRLRLFIHDEQERELQVGDISVDIQEGGEWLPLPLEPIDGGVMAAIGSAGLPHDQYHDKGGFSIDKKTIKEWQLRITLIMAGHYSLVAAVSPDNGSTHLVQPANLELEAL